jgi:DNA primase
MSSVHDRKSTLQRNEIRLDIAAIKQAVSLLDIAQSYGIKLRRQGREWSGLSPFKAEKTPSFYVDERKGLFKCFASGEGGDVIRFVQLMDGCDFAQAIERLRTQAGIADPGRRAQLARIYEQRRRDAEIEKAEQDQRHIAVASGMWHASQSGHGSPVETYLAARGIDLDALERVYGWRVPPALRFHPNCRARMDDIAWEGPAMLGVCAREVLGRKHLVGVHRTFIAPDGRGKADCPQPKMTLGGLYGAYTSLTPPATVAVLGEGYETVLSVLVAAARLGRRAYGVSGLFLGNICGAGIRRNGAPRTEISTEPDPQRPGLLLPDGVREVVLLKDADGKNPDDIDRFLRRAATKFQRRGLKVYIASPTLGDDFNDMAIRAAA